MLDPLPIAVSRFQAVSKWGETGKSLIICANMPPVSRFHDFPGRLPGILIWILLGLTRIAAQSEILDDPGRLMLKAVDGPPSSAPERHGACKGQNILIIHLVTKFRLLSQFKTRRAAAAGKKNPPAYPQNRETVKQAAVFDIESCGCRFHTLLKPLETVKQPRHLTPIDAQLQGAASA
jgi:hypothetical protein